MKTFLRARALTVLFIGSLHGASYTTVRSGDVTDTSHMTGPWCATASPCAMPGIGDTVIIANGQTLNLPAAASWTVGNSADLATYALRTAGVGGTGVFTMQAGSTMTVHGHVLQGNATWQIGSLVAGGATVIFDHPATPLNWLISDASSQVNAKLLVYGATGNRSVMRKSASGVAAGGFGMAGTPLDGGRVEAAYADFIGLGTGSISGFKFRASSSAFTLSFKHVKFDSVGQFLPQSQAIHGASNFIMEYVKVVNPSGTGKRLMNGAFAARTTGTRHVKNSYFNDVQIELSPGSLGDEFGFTFENVFFRNTSASVQPFNSAYARIGSINNCLIYGASTTASNGSTIAAAAVNGLYLLESTTTNSHPIQGIKYSSTWQKVIVESTIGQVEGDALQFTDSGAISTQTIDFRDVLIIQPPGTTYGIIVNNSATSVHSASNNYPNVTARNFTWRGGGSLGNSVQSGATGGESPANTGKLGLYADVSRHLVWSETPGTPAYITDYFSNTGATPPVNGTYTRADYNLYWNTVGGVGSTRYKYSGTTPTVYATPPGANDVNFNPRFLDTTRNFLKFGQSINPAHATIAQVMDEFAKVADDSGYNPRYNIPDLINWTRWGYVPQDPRAWVACNGSYCGAVDPALLRNSAAAAGAF